MFVFRFVMCVFWVFSRSCLTSTPAYTFQDVPELGKSRGSLLLVGGGRHSEHCAVVCCASGGVDRNSSHQHVFSAWAWRMGWLCHSPANPLNSGLDEPGCVDLWDRNGTQQLTNPLLVLVRSQAAQIEGAVHFPSYTSFGVFRNKNPSPMMIKTDLGPKDFGLRCFLLGKLTIFWGFCSFFLANAYFW